MAVYGSRDKNPFNVPNTYKINGVDTPSNIGNVRYYPLVDSSTGEVTIKSPTIAGAAGGSGLDRTIGTIPKDGVFKPVVGSTTSEETKYFSSAAGQGAVKNHAVITAQKAGAQNAQQLIFPNSATPGAGQGQNAPIPGVAGAAAVPADPAALNTALKSGGNTRNQFPTLKYPETLDAGKQDVITFSMLKYSPKSFDLTKINISGFGERAKDRTSIGRVTLPIPNGIIDSNAVTWGGDSMSAGEAFAANVALTTIKQGFSAGAGVIADAGGAAGANDVKTGFAAAFAAAAAGQDGARLLSRTEGAILNPNLELLFEAPTLRSFQFTFKLASRSKEESKIIRSIIRFFKQGSAAQKSESNLFLKAPHTFQIQYLHKNEEHKFLNKFKECALQSFGVSYTPEGQYATFNDGAMVSYQITMQFQELEPIFNEDYTNDGTNSSPDIGF